MRFRPARGARIETGESSVLAMRGTYFAPLAGRGLKRCYRFGQKKNVTFRPARGARIETLRSAGQSTPLQHFAPLAGRGLKPQFMRRTVLLHRFRPARGARIETAIRLWREHRSAISPRSRGAD